MRAKAHGVGTDTSDNTTGLVRTPESMNGLRKPALVAVLLALAACDRTPVVIGIANARLPIDGAVLALEEAEAAGLPVPVDTLIARSISTLAAPAVRAADTILSTAGVIAVVGHSNSAASVTAAPLYNEAGVVQLATHSTAEIYSHAGPFSFRMVPPDGQQGRLIADYLAANFPESRVALVYVNDDYGRGLRSAVLDALPPDTVHIILDTPHIERATPVMIRRTVLAVVDAEPDVVLWLSRALQLADYLPAIREGLGDVPFVGGDGLIPAEEFARGDSLWDNIHFVRLVDLEAPQVRAFRGRFRDRFDREADDAAALGYDAMGVLLAGIRDGARTGEELRQYLASLGRDRPPYPGIAGPVSFDEEGDAARDYVMKTTGTSR